MSNTYGGVGMRVHTHTHTHTRTQTQYSPSKITLYTIPFFTQLYLVWLSPYIVIINMYYPYKGLQAVPLNDYISKKENKSSSEEMQSVSKFSFFI